MGMPPARVLALILLGLSLLQPILAAYGDLAYGSGSYGVDLSNCPEQITSDCLCNGVEQSSGYCCNGSWQETQCTEEHVKHGGGGGGVWNPEPLTVSFGQNVMLKSYNTYTFEVDGNEHSLKVQIGKGEATIIIDGVAGTLPIGGEDIINGVLVKLHSIEGATVKLSLMSPPQEAKVNIVEETTKENKSTPLQEVVTTVKETTKTHYGLFIGIIVVLVLIILLLLGILGYKRKKAA